MRPGAAAWSQRRGHAATIEDPDARPVSIVEDQGAGPSCEGNRARHGPKVSRAADNESKRAHRHIVSPGKKNVSGAVLLRDMSSG